MTTNLFIKRKKNNTGFWGQFGDGVNIADGQAVRTNIIYDYLQKNLQNSTLIKVNTFNWKKSKFLFFIKTIYMILNSSSIIIAPADNGFKIIVPILKIFQKVKKIDVYYIVIGGFLPNLLRNKPKYIKSLNMYKSIFVQTDNIKRDLLKLGVINVRILSNMKNMAVRSIEDIEINNSEVINVCTLSRITKDKGIIEAIKAVKLANDKLGGFNIFLDIYGIIDEKFRQEFESIVKENSQFTKYKGILRYNQTADTLKNYYLLLFPTYYYGEGLAGNIIDAFFAGIPVIATDWNYNRDVISDGINGLLVRPRDEYDLAEKLLSLYRDKEKVYNISINNAIYANSFLVDNVLKELYNCIEESSIKRLRRKGI